MIQGERVGRMFRAVRQRLRLRQVDVARRAGVSDGTISRIERGRLDAVSLPALVRVADAIEIRIDLHVRWRGGELDRLVNARHAALSEDVVEWLARHPGWELRPEISFSEYGERGVVDLLAWHPGSRTLLVIELKTELVDLGENLATFDRKRRLASRIAATLGWEPSLIGVAFLIRDTRTNRRRVADHARMFRAALPDDGRRLRAWLAAPSGPLAALAFEPDRRPVSVRRGSATNRRVRQAREVPPDAGPSVRERPFAHRDAPSWPARSPDAA